MLSIVFTPRMISSSSGITKKMSGSAGSAAAARSNISCCLAIGTMRMDWITWNEFARSASDCTSADPSSPSGGGSSFSHLDSNARV